MGRFGDWPKKWRDHSLEVMLAEKPTWDSDGAGQARRSHRGPAIEAQVVET
jgi:hypothetical protein